MKTGDRESGTAATRLGDGLTRRTAIAGLTSLLATPKQSAAQQAPANLPRVGWIWGGRSAGNPIEVAGFRQGLKELGYIEGQNIIVEYRFGEGRRDRIPDLVAELVGLGPDVVVAVGDLIVSAVRSAARQFLLSGWPATRSAQGWSPAWGGRAATSPACR